VKPTLVRILVVVANIQMRTLKTEVDVGDYPLDLSILISGGKETKRDSLSNGERREKSPSLIVLAYAGVRCGVKNAFLVVG